ncbi:MAG: kinase [Negativicutes bacterium]|nr:kinase [Negativicutes bacterium]
MVITRTPLRISFFGGGTDLPAWFCRHGGEVISTTIDKYIYINCRVLPPFFPHRHRIAYSRVETVDELGDIAHPAVRAIFEHFNVRTGMDLHYDADVPANSGLGSSSSFVVGLIKAVLALGGRMVSQRTLADLAITIEQEQMRESVGLQDQIAAAFGGFNHIEFIPGDGYRVNKITVSQAVVDRIHSSLMLFFTGFQRFASTIEQKKIAGIENRTSERLMCQMADITRQATQILTGGGDIARWGHLLHESWEVKKALCDGVSNPGIDEIYERARRAGATGGKLLGAGGGGCMLLWVEQDRQSQVKSALTGLTHIPFRFDTTGSTVIYYKEDQYGQPF